MTEKGHYLKSDGNGGYVIKKDTMYIILAMITIISFLIGIGIAYATVVNDVATLKEEYKTAGPVHTSEINKIEDRMQLCEENIKVVNTNIDYIKSDISEIKADVKTLLLNN